MSEKSVSIAVIGAGKIAEVGHIPGFIRAGAQVAALCDVRPENLSRLAAAYPISRTYEDWRVMLADGGFDAVSICTPPVLHRDMVVASLEQGYATLVEKPMAPSLDDCQAMIDAADRTGNLLMVAHNQRFRAQHAFARQVLVSGRLGKVRRAHAVFAHGGPENWSPTGSWYFDPKLAGYGVLLDLGYHKIDLLRWLLGQDVVDTQIFTATFEKPTTIDDTAVAILRFDQGTLATLEVSWAHHPDVPDSVTINCERGTLTVPSGTNEPVRVLEQQDTGEIVETTFRPEASAGPGWFEMARAFVQAVRQGEASPLPGVEGKATLAAVLSLYASAGP